MVRSAAIVICLLVLGDVISDQYSLPVPGAALGLAMLTMIFTVRGGPDPGSEELFDFAAPYFPLFFVPAAVGVVANLDMLFASWVYIAIAIVAGTAVTLVATGIVFQCLLRRVVEGARV